MSQSNQGQQQPPTVSNSQSLYDAVEERTQGCLNSITNHFQLFNLLFFEFFAMVIFSFCVIWKNGLITYPGIFVTYAGMFISLVLSGSFGCGHINPAITFAFMIKKEGRTPIYKGIAFVVVHFAAAFIGTFIAWGVRQPGTFLTAPFPFVHDFNQPNAMLDTFFKELIGSGLFVLCVLILVSSDTTFTDSVGQTWGTVPLALIAVCILLGLGLGTNPAQALAFQTAYYAFVPNSWQELQSIWSVIIGSSVGGVIAGLFFEFAYRRYVLVYKKQLIAIQESHKTLLMSLMNKNPLDTTAQPIEAVEMAMQTRQTDIEL